MSMTQYQPLHWPRSKQSDQRSAPASATKRFVRTTLILLLLLGLLSGSVYGIQVWSNRSKVKALQAQMAAAFQEGGGPGRNREGFRDVRDQVKELPEQYQKEFRQGMRDMFRARMEKRMLDYVALDAAARRAELDKQIAEEEKRRAQREKRRKEREAEAAKNGGKLQRTERCRRARGCRQRWAGQRRSRGLSG